MLETVKTKVSEITSMPKYKYAFVIFALFLLFLVYYFIKSI